MSLLAAGITLGLLTLTGAWDENFKSTRCYQDGLENINDRMPINLGNLIALIEKWEREHTYQNPDAIADALLKRYRVDGITYQTSSNVFPWSPNELQEVDKQSILNAVLTPSETVPQNLYDPREECALHYMISHSTDTYPHAGLNYVWENTRRRRSDIIFPQNSQQRYSLPSGVNPAEHPIENGVIWTPSGPVAVGTLLSGIMASDKTSIVTIRQILGDTNIDHIPVEMQNKDLNPLYVSTLSGDIGQSAVVAGLAGTTLNQIYLGPNGKFNNLTAAPKLYTLANSYDGITSYLSRAEIFAGIDAMLISTFLRTSTSSKVRLSQILRMYYSEHGLPNNQDVRACNRMAAYKKLDSTVIQEQALNFMYIYSEKFPELKRMITENKDDFTAIERSLKTALNDVWKAFNTFVGNYDYTDYNRCPSYSKNEVLCENQVDLLMVYGHDSGITDMDKQRQYISLLAQMIGVSVEGSRLGILDGKSASWIVPMTNFSNVADAGSNFTTLASSYGSGSDMIAVLNELSAYYNRSYKALLSDGNNAKAHSQVVLWNVPGSIPTDKETFLEQIRNFRLSFPDVYFLLVGKSKDVFSDMLLDPPKDFYTNNVINMEEFAATLAKRICRVPSVFTYPACDSNNVNFTNYREQSHIYNGYVSPNFTTYIKIAPQYFHYSGELKLTVSNADIQVCSSRESMYVENSATDYLCIEGGSEFNWEELCGRWLEQCNPIYLSVTGKSDAGIGSYCQDEECQYPNQIQYEIRHEGMTCGAWWATPSVLLWTILGLIHFVNT
nr:uncharacterized protein LOC123758762 isoform X3 [Procambarus clarkii]